MQRLHEESFTLLQHIWHFESAMQRCAQRSGLILSFAVNLFEGFADRQDNPAQVFLHCRQVSAPWVSLDVFFVWQGSPNREISRQGIMA